MSPVAEMQDPMVPVSCTLSADEGGDRCFENTGDCHVPKLHDEFSTAGAGWPKAFSSSLLMKRCSSSTLSRRQARCAEAGGSHDSFESSFVCCADPVTTRVQRVTAALHGHHNACGTHLSLNSYSVHGACGVWNSENSRGDTEVGRQHFCVHGETKSLSTCTRTGVRRPAVEKLVSPQQVPLKLHEETWAGLLKNRGLRISQEVEIVPVCCPCDSSFMS